MNARGSRSAGSLPALLRGTIPIRVSTEMRTAVTLSLFGMLIAVAAMLLAEPALVIALELPLLLGSLFLGPRTLPWLVVVLMLCLTVSVSVGEIESATIIRVIVLFLSGLVVMFAGLWRARLGVAGVRGESMFVDLRDRILTQGRIPALPPQWHVETALHSAGGTPFAGDFIVAATTAEGSRLEVALVDVSGKGEKAGTRALLLAGAFGGLIGAVPPGSFLDAANGYLVRQDWDEGFATAVHLTVDLATGRYEVRSAGHPPAVLRIAGADRWVVLQSEGPALGLLPDIDYQAVAGTLRPGETIVMYTDGMVEESGRDLEVGIDEMIGAAETLLHDGGSEVAERLTLERGNRDDDRAVVLVTRRPDED